MGEKKENETPKINSSNAVMVCLVFLFFYYSFTFITTEGSSHPLVNSLFGMIIIIGILMLIFHKREIKEKKMEFL